MGRNGSDSRSTQSGPSLRRYARVLLLIAIGVSGCGGGSDGPARVPLSGRVTLDGNTSAEGRVRFAPAKGVSGPVASTAVQHGSYRFTRVDGPAAGAHDVVFELIPPESAAATRSTTPATNTGPKGGGVSPFVTVIEQAVVNTDSTSLDFDLRSPDR